MKIFQNGVLRKIFGAKTDEEVGGWRKLYNEEFIVCTLYLAFLSLFVFPVVPVSPLLPLPPALEKQSHFAVMST
jgi:hypothetical protein